MARARGRGLLSSVGRAFCERRVASSARSGARVLWFGGRFRSARAAGVVGGGSICSSDQALYPCPFPGIDDPGAGGRGRWSAATPSAACASCVPVLDGRGFGSARVQTASAPRCGARSAPGAARGRREVRGTWPEGGIGPGRVASRRGGSPRVVRLPVPHHCISAIPDLL